MANVQLAKNLKTLRKKYNYTQQDVSTFFEYYQTGILSLRAGTSGAGSEYTGSSLPILSVTLDELIAGNIHADQIRESMPIYKYRHSETVDHIHTLYLTDQEVNLIENFRDASENDRQMLLIFLNRKP